MRQDLSLPRVVCKYEDVFPDELQGLPPHRDVDFVTELHPGTSPISTTPHRVASIELQELKDVTSFILSCLRKQEIYSNKKWV